MTAYDWQRYVAEFVEEIREAFSELEIVHNIVWTHEEDWSNDLQQRQVDAAETSRFVVS